MRGCGRKSRRHLAPLGDLILDFHRQVREGSPQTGNPGPPPTTSVRIRRATRLFSSMPSTDASSEGRSKGILERPASQAMSHEALRRHDPMLTGHSGTSAENAAVGELQARERLERRESASPGSRCSRCSATRHRPTSPSRTCTCPPARSVRRQPGDTPALACPLLTNDRLQRLHAQRQTAAAEQHVARLADGVTADGRWSARRLLHALVHVEGCRALGIASGVGLNDPSAKRVGP